MVEYGINYSGLPEHLRGTMHRYIDGKIKPGGFLTAVLENNLTYAICRADSINEKHMKEIVLWLCNEAPFPCWGSPAKVTAWLEVTE